MRIQAKSTISDTLEKLDRSLEARFVQSSDTVFPSIAGGHAGVATFYAYYYALTGDSKHLENSRLLLERSLQHISENDVLYTFCSGIAGVGWLVQHLIERKLLEYDSDSLNDYDFFIAGMGKAQILQRNYDYLHGGLGCGIYLLDRPNNLDFLNGIFEALQKMSLKAEHGKYWLDLFTTSATQADTRPRVNFGLAHGMPSIIFFLAKFVEKNPSSADARELLHDAVRYMLHYGDIENYKNSFFPYLHIPGAEEAKKQSRLAWCYGDLGVLLSIFHASKALQSSSLEVQAVNMALRTTSRKNFTETDIHDGGICHGYAGVAHIYNRFYHFTRIDAFKDAALFWTGRLLEYINFVGGIEAYREYDQKENVYKLSHGLLTGSAGIGLVLISMIESKIEPRWDRFLLIS